MLSCHWYVGNGSILCNSYVFLKMCNQFFSFWKSVVYKLTVIFFFVTWDLLHLLVMFFVFNNLMCQQFKRKFYRLWISLQTKVRKWLFIILKYSNNLKENSIHFESPNKQARKWLFIILCANNLKENSTYFESLSKQKSENDYLLKSLNKFLYLPKPQTKFDVRFFCFFLK